MTDFRLSSVRDVNDGLDLKHAQLLAVREPQSSFSDLRSYYYSLAPEASADLHVKHETHFRVETARANTVLDRLPGTGPVLDVGCGAGQYLRATVARGRSAVGIDASLCQLILARRLMSDEHLSAELAAAQIENLPLADEAVPAVLLTDLIEHLDAPTKALNEVWRVLVPGGQMWLTTPNRFSLTSEPHVGLFGVGWLPRPLATAYVRARTGIDYSSIGLLSLWGLNRLIRLNFASQTAIQLPIPTESEIQAFSPVKRTLARIYTWMGRTRGLRKLALCLAPYFEAICTKSEHAE